ncbi:MAG: GGDEF domain-containing protein [Lachnospiraceae bacterium]|nr:GGDEF domain-containing protein [Lachnospiraceae bacterium]
MNAGKHKRIGVLISKPTTEYQHDLLCSIEERAAAYGYYTLVYSIFGGYGKNEQFVRGERMLADLPDYRNLDGILLCMDTFTDDTVVNRLLERVRTRATCPVVCVRRQYDGYHSVLVDDLNSMEGIVDHLVQEHNYRDFCYVSGPKAHPDAMKRLDCFRRMMAKYEIPLTDDDIFYGDFWRNQGEAAVAELLDIRTQYPDVIVCANDYMAMAVCNALSDRGIKVPEEIAVTGFDDVREAEAQIPALTSVRVDVANMGRKSVDMLVGLIRNETVPEIDYVTTSVVCRESCGCHTANKEDNAAAAVRKYFDASRTAEHYNMQTVFMSIDVENADSMDDLNEGIYTYIFNNENFRDFFLVLNDLDWAAAEPEDMRTFTDKVHLRTAIQETILLGHVDQVFAREDILPDEYVYDAPCGYYIVPLHFQELCYGYAMINFHDHEAPRPFFQYIITIISNVLERLRINARMKRLVDKLSSLYVSDVLTGLKNRYGFEEDSQRMYEQVKGTGRSFAIISIDMDGLKGINDNYGHAQGDVALRAIANSMYAACFANEQCYRVGGDEFQVLATDYSEDDVKRFYERFEGFLEDYNNRSKRPYLVLASYGHSICIGNESRELGEWMTLSDDRMYENKSENKKHRSLFREDAAAGAKETKSGGDD